MGTELSPGPGCCRVHPNRSDCPSHRLSYSLLLDLCGIITVEVFLYERSLHARRKDCWEHLYLLGFSSIQIASIRGVKQPSVKGYIREIGVSRTHSEAQKGREPWNKGKKGSQVPWNKGKTGVQESTRKGTKQPKRGPRKPEHIEKIKQGWKNKIESGWNEFGGFGQKPSPKQRLLPGTLYFIRYLDESGIHYKIGITKRSLSERFKPHQLISILAIHHATLGECFDLEQSLLKWAKSQGYRYSSPTTTELIHPPGYSEVLQRLQEAGGKIGF